MNLIKYPNNTKGHDGLLSCISHTIATPLLLYPLFFFLSVVIYVFMMDSLAQGTNDSLIDERIVTGTGRIINENIALARNNAIGQGFSKALEGYLIQRIGHHDMANNFQQLDEKILSKTKEKIQDYQIISEFHTNRYVKILMKVRINKAIFEKELEKMKLSEIDTMQTGVLLMISERRESLPAIYWWGDPANQTSLTQTELFLSQALEKNGFRVINRTFFPSQESYDESMLHVALSNEAAVKWGRLLSAQIVIAGEANLYDLSKASIFFKVIKVMDGTVIAQSHREEIRNSTPTNDQIAIELAITSWATDTISSIIEAVQPTQKAVSQIVIKIEGIKKLRDFLYLKTFLKNNFPEIQSVLEKSIKKDLVRVSVEAEGDSKELAKKVLNHPKRPFSFEINEVSDQGFTVAIR